MKKKEVALKLFQHLCEHDWHGYSQRLRWGDGEGTCDIKLDGVIYHLEQGDRDCSSAIISCFESAGISCGGATYTGNMRDRMVAIGNFRERPMSFIAQPADVYLNHINHTAMCISATPDILGEFSISENGGIDGVTGDQTGNESSIKHYYDYPWNCILQCVNEEETKNHNNVVTYTVQRGDSLWMIAQDFKTTVDKLVADNNIVNKNLIYAGQILFIKR